MLDKVTLTAALKAMFEENAKDDGMTTDKAAEKLADIIDTYVRNASVVVTAPTGTIQVVGTPSAQSNVVPIVINGNLT